MRGWDALVKVGVGVMHNFVRLRYHILIEGKFSYPCCN